MTTLKSPQFAVPGLVLGLFALAAVAPAQTSQPHPWRAADQQAQAASSFPTSETGPLAQFGEQQPLPPPRELPPPQPPDGRYANDNFNVPARLAIRPGTFVTVRMNQWLSSDRNQQGDTFYATLADPLVVDGVVVAQRGQNVAGRVTEAVQAGRAQGTSRLGFELTELSLVDGQQVSIQSQAASRAGRNSVGRDVGAVATTTALGAAIGASADYGRGAAIGAGVGAAAGILGVLLTRGQPTVVAPETLLTFRIEAPVNIATDRAPQAFRFVEPPDYQRQAGPPQTQPRPGYAVAPPPYPGYGPQYAPYSYWGYGPGLSVYVGPRRGYFRGYGYRGGFRR